MMKLKRIIALLLTVTLQWNVAYAAFDDNGVGARAPGLADAFVGVADDANALYYNPAGLAQLVRPEVVTEFSRFNVGLDDGSELGTRYLGFARPMKGKRGTLAMAYHDFKLTSLYNERTLFLSYGWEPKFQPFKEKATFLTGATLKHLHREFIPNVFTDNALNDAGFATDTQDPLFASNGHTKDTFGIDLGSLVRFGQRNQFSAGLTLMNLNQPDVSLAGDGDKLPIGAKVGLGYRAPWGLLSTELRRLKRLESSSDTEVAFGGERRFNFGDWGALELRGGYAEGSREYKAVNMGLSYLFGKSQFDYSFAIPIGNLSETGGSHRVAFTFRWGGEVDKGAETVEEEDLLKAFEYNEKAAQVILHRLIENKKVNEVDYYYLLQMLMNMYPTDSAGMSDIRKEFFALPNRGPLIDWMTLRNLATRDVKSLDRPLVIKAIDALLNAQSKDALVNMKMSAPESQIIPIISSLIIITRTHLAAEAYRNDDIKTALLHVTQIKDAMPKDLVVKRAYDELTLLLPVEVPAEKALPEAPTILTAPEPVKKSTETEKGLSEFDALVKAFRDSLGYYFTRKAEGATLAERQHLLKQMLDVYGNKGIDMSLVEKELKEVEDALRAKMEAAPVPAPVEVKTEPKPEPKKDVKKFAPHEVETELKRAWRYYKRATRRGLTDPERIEILQDILERFNPGDALKIESELKRLQSRLD